MPTRHQFRPGPLEGLEERKVLSGSSGAVATVSAGQGPAAKGVASKSISIAALVNESFAAFSRDYNATRGVYFASIQARTAPIGATAGTDTTDPTGDLAAFQQYTRQRVTLLAQQLRNNFQQSSLYTAKKKHDNTDPLAVIARKINGEPETPTAKNPFNNGTLGKSLYQSIPSPTASPTAVALNALAEDNAIESARVAIINGLNSLKVEAARKH